MNGAIGPVSLQHESEEFTMRLTIFGLTIAGFALDVSPTWAQQASVFEQYVATAIEFGDAGGDSAEVRAQILDGLEGDWFPIGVVQPRSDDPKLFALVCEKSATAITVPNDFSFQASRNSNTETSWTTIYTSRQGHEFGSYTDPEDKAAWLGIDPKSDIRVFESVLKEHNGTVKVRRPTPDILVIQKSVGGSDILARCAS